MGDFSSGIGYIPIENQTSYYTPANNNTENQSISYDATAYYPKEEQVCQSKEMQPKDKVSTENKTGKAKPAVNFYETKEEKLFTPVESTFNSFAPVDNTFVNIQNSEIENTYVGDMLNMCIDPKSLISEKNTHLSSDLFTSNIDNSKVVVDMNLDIQDRNGFNNLGKDDITGRISSGSIQVNRSLFDKAILGLKGFQSKEGSRTTTINDVKFDSAEKAYVIDVKVNQNAWKLDVPLVWDNFQVKIKIDDNSQLTAKLDQNWIFDSMIIDKLDAIIRSKVSANLPKDFKNVSIDIKKNDDSITLVPEVHDFEVPIADKGSFTINHIDGNRAKFNLDEKGNLQINLEDVSLKGSTSLSPSAPKVTSNKDPYTDFAQVNVKFGLKQDDTKEAYARGKIGINLDEQETSKVKMGHESLGNYFSSGKILDDFSVYTTQNKSSEIPQVQSKNYVYIQDAKIGDKKVDLETSLSLSFDPKEGIKLEDIGTDDKPLDMNTTKNGVELFVNGSQYFPEMQKMIKDAKESVNLETYMLHDDSSGQKAMYLLAKKAAGLEATEGKVKIESKKGLDVRVIFNSWQGKLDRGKESEDVIKKEMEKVKSEIEKSNLTPKQKETAIKNMEDNFKFKFFTDGVLRSDHRKVFVVDGNQATVGGMNMGSQYLSNDAYHDVMLKIAGPEVRNVQKEFYENWFEFNNLKMPDNNEWNKLLKPEADLQKDLEKLQKQGKFTKTANISTLVTDDNQTDIKKGILKLIDSAKTEVNIEQAFFSDSDINNHLSDAMKRGVKVNIIVAKKSLMEMFDYANLNSVNELLKTKKEGAKGDVKLFYYDSPTGNDSKFIHAKAISIDNEKAIIGSANMIGRSLESPFRKIDSDGKTAQTLYNKELSLFVQDPKMVDEINDRLFESDINSKAKEVSPKEIEELIKKMGGENELKKKALAAKLT